MCPENCKLVVAYCPAILSSANLIKIPFLDGCEVKNATKVRSRIRSEIRPFHDDHSRRKVTTRFFRHCETSRKRVMHHSERRTGLPWACPTLPFFTATLAVQVSFWKIELAFFTPLVPWSKNLPCRDSSNHCFCSATAIHSHGTTHRNGKFLNRAVVTPAVP